VVKMKVRRIDYYDLIALPSGKHIPVPIAIEIIGLKNILKIPVAKIMRNERFYWCEECAKEAEEWGEFYEGSFFKCLRHSKDTQDDYELKYIALREIVRKKQFYKLRYIRSLWTEGCIYVDEKGRIVGRSFFGRSSWKLWAKTKHNKDIYLCNLVPADPHKIWWKVKDS